MRICPFDGCGRHIPDSMFACNQHWRLLNREQQKTVYRIYNEYLDGTLSLDELRVAQAEVLAGVK